MANHLMRNQRNYKIFGLIIAILSVLFIVTMGIINGETTKNSDLTTKNGGLTTENSGLTTKNGGLTTKNSGLITKADGLTAKIDGLQILKSQVTSTVKFYPYTVNGVKMEVMAVKASDGTIRTAFNTCQVCYDSGRGFYTQQGNEVVCNNCGNRFLIDKIEKIKNGCNPIPILPENKKDSGKYINVSKDFLAKYSAYFKNWKR